MKHLNFLFLFIALVVLAACSKSEVENEITIPKNQVRFAGVIGSLKTRVTNNSWEENDKIGIFALHSNKNTVYNSKHNVEYTTRGDGVFATTTNPIHFPDNGDNLDFIAYYPYDSKLTELEYSITSGTDPLYSNNAKAQNRKNPNVDLEFNHMLSKVVLNVLLGDKLTSIKGLEASLSNVVIDGKYNLSSGNVSLGNRKENIIPIINIAKDNNSATLSALIMPGQDIKNMIVRFSLGGNVYKWSPAASMKTASSEMYIYDVELNVAPEPTAVQIGVAKLNDWTVGYRAPGVDSIVPEDNDVPTSSFFSCNVSNLSFEADTKLSSLIKLNTTNTQAWTISKTAEWLALSSHGYEIGPKEITVTAAKNTSSADRSAIIILNPLDNKELSSITITATQKGGKPTVKNDGSLEHPYTVKEAIANQGSKGNKDYVWVRAFIVGTESSGLSLDYEVAHSNLLIADNKEDHDISKTIPAELPDNKVREALNLKENRDMYKKEVLLYGTLEPYFKGPGLKNIKDHRAISQ